MNISGIIIIIATIILIFLHFYIGKSNYRKILRIKFYRNSENSKLIVIGVIGGIMGAGLMGYIIPIPIMVFILVTVIFLMFSPSLK